MSVTTRHLRAVPAEPKSHAEKTADFCEDLFEGFGRRWSGGGEDFIAALVEDADERLMEAAKCATRHERPDLHLLVVKQRAALADLLIELGKER